MLVLCPDIYWITSLFGLVVLLIFGGLQVFFHVIWKYSFTLFSNFYATNYFLLPNIFSTVLNNNGESVFACFTGEEIDCRTLEKFNSLRSQANKWQSHDWISGFVFGFCFCFLFFFYSKNLHSIMLSVYLPSFSVYLLVRTRGLNTFPVCLTGAQFGNGRPTGEPWDSRASGHWNELLWLCTGPVPAQGQGPEPQKGLHRAPEDS